ncbi:hypothetical protein J437_LFUL016256 [Ladona fulva]|uniref:Uncharacterized protein n=1 Tax=Ladona fulva TaxID=123851 RepID=A0A8K0KLF4_LADFU|nr:hypothetical protein J437_LFUL016256 [Ladona fulva]
MFSHRTRCSMHVTEKNLSECEPQGCVLFKASLTLALFGHYEQLSVANGLNPVSQNFCTRLLRPHMIKIFQNKSIEPFPTKIPYTALKKKEGLRSER